MRAALLGTAVFLATAGGAAAQSSIEIEDAVARVTVITEARNDVDVQIAQGSAGLPAVTVTRRGGRVFIDGNLDENDIRSCSSRGDQATVEVRGVGRIDLNQAPRIVIRAPLDLEVEADGAVWGAVGRSRRLDLANAGCGDWTVANVGGPLEIASAGSGDIRAGTAESAKVRLAGSGDVSLVSVTNGLDVNVAGSGDVSVGRADGVFSASIAGSGNVVVDGGRAREARARIAGSGDVRYAGVADSLSASIAGSGDVSFQRVNGPVSRSVVGSGDVRIGSN